MLVDDGGALCELAENLVINHHNRAETAGANAAACFERELLIRCAFADTDFELLGDFVKNCPSEMKEFYGKKEAEKVCGCFYDRLIKDKERFAQYCRTTGYRG